MPIKKEELPKGFMEVTSEGTQRALRSVERVPLVEKLQKVAEAYERILERDSPHSAVAELSQEARREVAEQTRQVGILKGFLADFFRNSPAFEAKAQGFSANDGTAWSSFRRSADRPFGVGWEKGQMQIRFFVRDDRAFAAGSVGEETVDEATESLSLRGYSAPRTIRERERRLRQSEVVISLNWVFQDPDTKMVVRMPQVGIRLARSPEGITFGGVKFVGQVAHTNEFSLPEGTFGRADYEQLKTTAVRLSGYRPPSRRSH